MHLMYFTSSHVRLPGRGGLEKQGGVSALLSPTSFRPPGSHSITTGWRVTYYAEEMGVDGIMLNEHQTPPSA